MRVLTWASGHKSAIRKARRYRNWRAFGVLTKFQYRYESGNWSQWFYIKHRGPHMTRAEKRVFRAAMRWQRKEWPDWDKKRYPEVYEMSIGKLINACAALSKARASRGRKAT